ncbi:LPS-assembly protein LptD [Sulfurospirillum oryzae]|uniref:LPS-assembly protein LptD n=1 Tax=Sulfurospirillum oryzae TaxID=2976535 RepID=UPI0021E6D925|nr:LPS assembly protein LptD [Sulfurospirillum oryzae]
MRIRIFFLLVLSLGSLWAATAQKAPEDVEVLANTVSKDGTLVHAVGNVVLYSPKYLITADEAYYDQANGDLELFGNITMLEGVSYASRSGHTKINLNTDKGVSDPLFFFDESSNVWIKCENAILNPDTYITQKSIVSSCNTQDPDWKIAFTSGEFDKENKWLHLYNPVFYASDVPVFYLPYFSFTTDTSRRTGLLKPELGFGGKEGFHYLQPIYFAPDVDWDLELRPQIRTDRGEGLHGTYRFVDSPYSHGSITTGYFSEHKSYAESENLKNDSHYGLKMTYDRSALLSTKYNNLEDGLWFDINYLNDIDYYNTMRNDTFSYDKLATSRLNYYVKHDQDYVGLYAKYYIDTSKTSNDTTLQELPTLHYHHFTNSLLLDNLLYSVDYQAKNYERKEGITAFQNELNAPFTLYFSLLEDYLHVSVSENIYASHIAYGNDDTQESEGKYWRNYHKIALYTELSKPYDNFYHTMYLGIDQILPSKEDENGYIADFIALNTLTKSTSLTLKEFFYNEDGDKKISHKVKQIYYSDYDYKYGDLENDLKYHMTDKIYLGHNLHYSHEFSKVSRNQVSINYADDIYSPSLRYTYQDKTYRENTIYKVSQDISSNKDYSFVTLYADSKYFTHYNIFTSVDYDVQDDQFRSWNIGFKKSLKCWDYSIQYRDKITPKLTSTSIDSVNRSGIMFMFNLYPVGSVGYDFSKETEQKL